MARAAALAKSAAAGGPGARKSKRKNHTDERNSNTRMFEATPQAVTKSLQQWRASASSASSSGASMESEEESKSDSDVSGDKLRAQVRSMQPVLPTARTENGDLAFKTSRIARLDLFYRLVRGAENDAVQQLVAAAWQEQAEHTVQLLMHSRDARGGKGERLITLYGLMYLRKAKPQTYLLNLTTFLGLGYFKDLLSIAAMVEDDRGQKPMGAVRREDLQIKMERHEARIKSRKGAKKAKLAAAGAAASAAVAAASDASAAPVSIVESPVSLVSVPYVAPPEILELEVMAEYLKADWARLQAYNIKYAARKAELARKAQEMGLALAVLEAEEKRKEEEAAAAASAPPTTREEEIALAARLISEAAAADAKLNAPSDSSSSDEEDEEEKEDADGWEKVGRTAAELDADLDSYMVASGAASSSCVPAPADAEAKKKAAAKKSRAPRGLPHLQLSLAAKWAPTEGSSFDKKHHLAKRLARLMFPGQSNCFRLYREALSAMRAHLNVTERHMCARNYDAIDFEKIPSKCHQLLKNALAKHCAERYTEYRAGLKKGTKTIKTAGLMPHELATPYITSRVREVDETIEGAWRTLLAKLKAKCSSTGGLASAVAIVDVSGSMHGMPMNVAISLGLLVAELARGPFQGRVITFSEHPAWHVIPQGCSLYEQVTSLERAAWGMSTNLRAVFSMILATAVAAKCPKEDLPKTLFIFSDMQFNAACGDSAASTGQGVHADIKAKYRAAGYDVPNVVYWNLRGETKGDLPVDVSTPGMSLISGYSAELLKSFLEGCDIDPINILLHSIAPYKDKAIIEESER